MARKTRSKHGPEGRACAGMRAELLAREPWAAFQVYVTCSHGKYESFRCRTQEEATQRLAAYLAGRQVEAGTTYSVEEVRVRFVPAGHEVREEVVG